MKNIKRFLALLLAAAVMVSTAACGNNTGASKESEDDNYEFVSTSTYLKLKLTGDQSDARIIGVSKDGIDYLEVLYDENYITHKMIYHKDSLSGEEIKSYELMMPDSSVDRENCYTGEMATDKDGNLYLISEKYTEVEDDYKIFLDKYDTSGKLVETYDLSGIKQEVGMDYVSTKIIGDDGNFYFSAASTLYCSDLTGHILFKVTTDNWFDRIFKGDNSNIYVSMYDKDKYVVKKIDAASKSLVDTKFALDASRSRDFIATGSDVVFSTTNDKVFLSNISTGDDTPLWTWLDLDYSNVYPEKIWDNGDGSYGFAIRDYESGYDQVEIVTVKKELVTAENRRVKLIFGCRSYLDDSVKKSISDFNKTNGKYKVVIKSYFDEYGYEQADAMLKADIAANKLDIVSLDVYDTDLINKGSFVDLSGYFDNDADINKEDFFTNVLDASRVDGKMYFISPMFGVNTLVGNAKYVGKNDSWTLDDFLKLREQYPDKEFFTYGTQESVLSYLLVFAGNDFIDMGKGTCNFNNDEFKKLLKVAKTFPEEINYEDYDDWGLILSEDIFLASLYMSDFDSILLYDKLFGDNMNIIGFPTSSGAGHSIFFRNYLSICSGSKNKDAAWEFLKSTITEKAYSSLDWYDGFPLRKSSFETALNKAVSAEHFGGGAMGNGTTTIEYGAPTEETANIIRDIVNKADSMAILSEKVYTIIQEEVEPYFKGEKDVDSTADAIQKRVNLYLAETK